MGETRIGKIRQRCHDAEVTKAKLEMTLEKLSPDQEANLDIVDSLRNARATIYELLELIDDISL